MIKKIVALVTSLVFVFSMLASVTPVFANDVEIKIKNSDWGVVDGNKIKWIPQQLSVQRFLENISVAGGGNADIGVYAADGVSSIIDGYVRNGQKLKVTQGNKTSIYDLELALYVDYKMLFSGGETTMTFPQQGQPAPDFPHTGVMVLEGSFTMTSKSHAQISMAYYEPTDYAIIIEFKEDGTISQFWGDNLGDRVKYEINKPTHFVVVMDLNESRALTYVNGVAVSKDTVRGDKVAHLSNTRTFNIINVPREHRLGFVLYTLPTMQDFDITAYRCNLTSNNDNVIIDNDEKIIKITDEKIVTKRDLFKCFTFADDAEAKRVILEDVTDGEVFDNAMELSPRHFVSVKSKNGKVTSQFEIQSVLFDKKNKLSDADEKKAGLLKAIGILDKNEVVVEQAIVSRADFARYLSRLVNCVSDGNPDVEMFIDVKKGNKYASYINAVANRGFMSGRGDGSFGANSKITYEEAIASVIRAAGYEDLAKAKGGWPSGYMAVANLTKLTKSVQNSNGQLTRLDAVRLLYNTLMLPYNDVYTVTKDFVEYSSYSGETILGHYHKVYEDKGRVTANKFTGIYSENDNSTEDAVAIDGKEFVIPEGSGYESYLGMNIEYFFKEEENGRVKVLFMSKSPLVESVTVKAEDISSVTNAELCYTGDDNKIKKIKLASGFSLIYNGRLNSLRTKDDLFIKDGEITLIDSQGKGSADIIIAREPEYFEFDAMNESRKLIIATDKDGNFVDVELDEELYSIYKIDSLGGKKVIELSEIERDSVLTVYRSLDKECIEIEATNISKKGKITYREDDIVGVNDVAYRFASSISKEEADSLRLDTEYTFKMNSFGKIAFVKKGDESFNYGYIIGIDGGSSFGNSGSFARIIIGAEEYKDYTLAEKLLIDGVKYTKREMFTETSLKPGDALTPELIRYKLDSDSNLKVIDILERSDGEDIESAMYMNTAGLELLDGRIILGDSTYFLSVPIAEERKDHLCYKKPEFENERGQNVTVFDYNPDDRTCGAVITYATTATSGNEFLSMQGQKGVVKKVRMARSDDGSYLMQLEIITGAEAKTLFIDDEYMDENPDLKFGDVVRYITNSAGDKIQDIVREFRVNPNGTSPDMTPHSNHDYYIFRRGPIIDKAENYIVINDEEEGKEVILPVSSKAFIVDFETETITPATVKDFVPNIHYLYEHSPGLYAPSIMVGYMFSSN